MPSVRTLGFFLGLGLVLEPTPSLARSPTAYSLLWRRTHAS